MHPQDGMQNVMKHSIKKVRKHLSETRGGPQGSRSRAPHHRTRPGLGRGSPGNGKTSLQPEACGLAGSRGPGLRGKVRTVMAAHSPGPRIQTVAITLSFCRTHRETKAPIRSPHVRQSCPAEKQAVRHLSHPHGLRVPQRWPEAAPCTGLRCT